MGIREVKIVAQEKKKEKGGQRMEFKFTLKVMIIFFGFLLLLKAIMFSVKKVS